MNEYPENWLAIAHSVKILAGWRCERCKHPHDPTGELPCDELCDLKYKHPKDKQRGVGVHHLDGDKSNCAYWNLVCLCVACHLQIQVKVKMEQMWIGTHSRWFLPHLFGYLMKVSPKAMTSCINRVAEGKYK